MRNISDKINEDFYNNIGADVDGLILSKIKYLTSKNTYKDLIRDTFNMNHTTYSYYKKAIWNIDSIKNTLTDIISKGYEVDAIEVPQHYDNRDKATGIPYMLIFYNTHDKLVINPVTMQPYIQDKNGELVLSTVESFCKLFK